MKNALIALWIMLPAMAFAENYQCRLQNGPEEYAVNVNFVNPNKVTAAFFDNNDWEQTQLTGIEALECVGCPTNYLFSGPTTKIVFSLPQRTDEAPSGYIIVSGGRKPVKYALKDCKKKPSKNFR